MFTKLYLYTTNPKVSWYKFFSKKVMLQIILSIIFHTIIYVLFCNLVSYIFFEKIIDNNTNKRLLISLLLLMFLGYIGRFYHVKQVYKDFNYDYNETKKYLDIHYNSWIFIG